MLISSEIFSKIKSALLKNIVEYLKTLQFQVLIGSIKLKSFIIV